VKQTAGMREGTSAQIRVSLQDGEPAIWRRPEGRPRSSMRKEQCQQLQERR
jgi:hypothetical protein